MLYKNHIFQCMGKIFCVEFQRCPLKFRTKYLPYTLKDVYSIHMWKFKKSCVLKRPPGLLYGCSVMVPCAASSQGPHHTLYGQRPEWVDTLAFNDAIWCHRPWSTLVQVMACCLTAPSHYWINVELLSARSTGTNNNAFATKMLSHWSKRCIWKLYF